MPCPAHMLGVAPPITTRAVIPSPPWLNRSLFRGAVAFSGAKLVLSGAEGSSVCDGGAFSWCLIVWAVPACWSHRASPSSGVRRRACLSAAKGFPMFRPHILGYVVPPTNILTTLAVRFLRVLCVSAVSDSCVPDACAGKSLLLSTQLSKSAEALA